MKLLTYKLPEDEREYLGVMCSNAYRRFWSLDQLGMHFKDMNDLIERITPEQREKLEEYSQKMEGTDFRYDKVIKCAPIPRPKQDIICLGLNFMDHEQESLRFKKQNFERDKEYAVYFSKRVNEATPDGGEIYSYPGLVDSLDYEVELAVIIGKDAKNVRAEDAYDYVFGYTVMNDVSARNLQTRHKQWYLGKSLDGFTPMGPVIVTENEMKRPPALSIKSRLNGVLRQNSSTNKFIFDIPHVIEDLSRGMTLKKGTIIAMGTPAGVGMGMFPPQFLKPGDEIECSIEGIGYIRNKIV